MVMPPTDMHRKLYMTLTFRPIVTRSPIMMCRGGWRLPSPTLPQNNSRISASHSSVIGIVWLMR